MKDHRLKYWFPSMDGVCLLISSNNFLTVQVKHIISLLSFCYFGSFHIQVTLSHPSWKKHHCAQFSININIDHD